MKIITTIAAGIIISLSMPAVAFAHVVVTPTEVTSESRQIFTLSVPNEKDVAVTAVTLTIPEGIDDLQPNVSAGWNISTQANAKGVIQSVTWKGEIPAGQRADLVFKAMAPAKTGDIAWKATQVYADGSQTKWDQSPDRHDEQSVDSGPYSVTHVTAGDDTASNKATTDTNGSTALLVASGAFILSAAGLFIRRK